VPILFLDSFSVHLKGSNVRKIQDLRVQVEFIPPGCTGLLQPVDVGFNKAFKAKMRMEYTTAGSLSRTPPANPRHHSP
jgi:hypothetical protein